MGPENAPRPTLVYVYRYSGLGCVFAAGVLYFVAVQHLTNLYATEHHGVTRFILILR